jgi:hypothetical protein
LVQIQPLQFTNPDLALHMPPSMRKFIFKTGIAHPTLTRSRDAVTQSDQTIPFEHLESGLRVHLTENPQVRHHKDAVLRQPRKSCGLK